MRAGVLKVGDTVQLVPSDLYPTVNRHACLVGVRDGVVETMFPVDARDQSEPSFCVCSDPSNPHNL